MLDQVKEENGKICEYASNFLMATISEQATFEEAKTICLSLTEKHITVEQQFQNLIKINDQSYELLHLQYNIKTKLLYQNKVVRMLSKKLKAIIERKREKDEVDIIEDSNVHDDDAIIIYISGDIDKEEKE